MSIVRSDRYNDLSPEERFIYHIERVLLSAWTEGHEEDVEKVVDYLKEKYDISLSEDIVEPDWIDRYYGGNREK